MTEFDTSTAFGWSLYFLVSVFPANQELDVGQVAGGFLFFGFFCGYLAAFVAVLVGPQMPMSRVAGALGSRAMSISVVCTGMIIAADGYLHLTGLPGLSAGALVVVPALMAGVVGGFVGPIILLRLTHGLSKMIEYVGSRKRAAAP